MAGTIVADTIQDGAGNSTSMDNAIYGSAKAWVNFVGNAVSIRASYNVSSVTRVATGNWQINLTNAMTDSNFACHYTPSNGSSGTYYVGAYPSSSSQVTVWNFNGSAQVDTSVNSVSVFR
jgi:hypothetical protein